jgi:hypothetical protein
MASTQAASRERMMHRDIRDEEADPMRGRNRAWAVYVERTTHQWVVLDPDGQFWILPVVDDPWRHRRPFQPTDETSLDPVPGHYRHVLGLPL